MNVRVDDFGMQRLKRDLEALQKLRVFVGYQNPEGNQRYVRVVTKKGKSRKGGPPVAKIAAIHEFGSPSQGIPARPFIRSTLHEQRTAIAFKMSTEVKQVIEGRTTPVQAMSSVGEFARELVRNRLKTASGWAAPLKPETVDRKDSSTPLEETRLLFDALSWAVRDGQSVVARSTG